MGSSVHTDPAIAAICPKCNPNRVDPKKRVAEVRGTADCGCDVGRLCEFHARQAERAGFR